MSAIEHRPVIVGVLPCSCSAMTISWTAPPRHNQPHHAVQSLSQAQLQVGMYTSLITLMCQIMQHRTYQPHKAECRVYDGDGSPFPEGAGLAVLCCAADFQACMPPAANGTQMCANCRSKKFATQRATVCFKIWGYFRASPLAVLTPIRVSQAKSGLSLVDSALQPQL